MPALLSCTKFRLMLSLSLLLVGLGGLNFSPRALAASTPGPALAAVLKAGKLRVAIDATYPPMESEDKAGKPAGFDIDFSRNLAKRLGVEAEFVVMSWDGIVAGLGSNRYDVIISTMNITAERAQQVDFVEYLRMSQVFVTTGGLKVTKDTDLAGKTIAVQADTTSADYVAQAKKRGIALGEVKAFKLGPDAFAALRAKQAEVIVIDEPVAKYFTLADRKTFQITGRAMAPEPVGIATRKTDKDLTAAIATAVAAMRSDGTLKKLQATWFGSELGDGAE